MIVNDGKCMYVVICCLKWRFFLLCGKVWHLSHQPLPKNWGPGPSNWLFEPRKKKAGGRYRIWARHPVGHPGSASFGSWTSCFHELLSTFVFAMFAAHSGSRVQTTLQRWSRRTCPDPCGTVFQGSFSVFSTLVHVLVSFYIHSIQIRIAHWHFTTLVFHVPGASAYLCRRALRPPRPLPLDSSAFRRRLAVKVQHGYSSIL